MMSDDARPLTGPEIDALLVQTVRGLLEQLQDVQHALAAAREEHAEAQARWLALENRRN